MCCEHVFWEHCITNSTLCPHSCLYYSYITNSSNTGENFQIDEQNKPDIISSLKIVQSFKKSFKVVLVNSTVFIWPSIFSKNGLTESVYLITVNVVNGDNSTESVIGLESRNNFDLKNTFLCDNLSSVSSFDIVPKYQFNIYPINYNGYNKSIKLTSNFTNCYISSYANQCICNITAVQQSSQSQPTVVLPIGSQSQPTFVLPIDYLVGNVPTPLEKGKIIALIPNLNIEYFISFDVYPNKFLPDYHSLIHFTIGSDNDNYGDRTPGIWFDDKGLGKLQIAAPINGNRNSYFFTKPVASNQWSNVEVSQTLKNSVYIYQVKVNGEIIYSANNYKAQSFENVKVYASDPWSKPHNGSIRNLFFINGNSSSRSQPVVFLPIDFIYNKNELALVRGFLIGTLNVLMKVYTVSFNIKPTRYTKGLKNVLHLTQNEDRGTYGDRNPGIWFDEDGSGKLIIFAAVSRNASYYIKTDPLLIDQWSFIKISQSLLVSKYWLSIELNGVNIHTVENTDPRDFKNMKVYASDLWYGAQDGSITNLLILNGKVENIVGNIITPLERGQLIAEIPKLDKEYFISFDIYPNEVVPGWHNVIHFTIGSEYGRYGDRTPGIFFHKDGDGKVEITAPISGEPIFRVNTNPIEINKFSNIQISQNLNDNIYVFLIRVNGKLVYHVNNNQAEYFKNVKVYASNPWNDVQIGSIKDLFIINGFINSSMFPVVIYHAERQIQPTVALPIGYFSYRKEFTLIKGLCLGILGIMRKEYTVYFKFKPKQFTKGLKSVLHLTLGNNSGSYGDRNPGIWFHEDGSGKLIIFVAVNGNNSYYIETTPLLLDEWSTVKIHQSLLVDKYWLAVELNGVIIHLVENSDPRDFKNMNVYASDIWYDAQNGSITDLLIINGNVEYFVDNDPIPLEKDNIIAEIPMLEKEYFMTFDVYPYEFNYDWHSVIHFTIGSNNYYYGDRTPGIWFEERGLGNLHIAAPINGIANNYFNTNPVKLNQWTNVEVLQTLINSVYIYQIKINGKLIRNVTNNRVQCFENVKVYASDPWTDPQNGTIKNLFFINGNSSSQSRPAVVLPIDFIYNRNELVLVRGFLIGTLNVLLKVYTVSFNIKPTKYTMGFKNVLRLTQNEDIGINKDRNQGVWFDEDGSGKLIIFTEVNNNVSYIKTAALMINQWTSIKICQSLLNGKHWLSIEVNRVNIHTVENKNPRDFKNIKVYASDLWYDVLDGSISDFFIINGKVENIVGNFTPLERGKIIAEIPLLEKEYFISFDINLNEFVPGWHNAIHFTTGSVASRFESGSPCFFFYKDENGRVKITNQINGDSFYEFNTDPNEINKFLIIQIIQIFKKNIYKSVIRINGKVVYSVDNNQAEYFKNVKVYASNPWNDVQSGSIKNMFIVNGITNSSIQPAVVFLEYNSGFYKDKSSIILAITVPILFLVLIVTVVVTKMYRSKSKHKLQRNRMQNFKLSTDDWEISPDTIIFDKKIGEGAFGAVFFAKINSKVLAKTKSTKQKPGSASLYINQDFAINVAVKLLKDSANQSEFDDFREEINLMKEIGYHKNIVNMLGCSTIVQPLCLVVEFMENGDLLHFLRNRRNKLCASKFDGESAVNFIYTKSYQQTLETTISEICTAGYMPNEIPLDEIGLLTPNDLLSFAWQAASGMEFLSCNKLVHRDLAARNILVGGDKNIKISDFGLTRKTNEELNYTSNKNRRLPIKWMSIEAIFDQMFTSCSDVWAYGVVLFEIVTLGGTPYPTKSNSELLALLKTGYRMERPENCSEPMYDIMLHCWNEDPLQRPTFTELREHLDKIISQGDSYFNFDVNEQNTYYNAPSFNSLEPETPDDATDKEIFDTTLHVKSNEEMHIFSEGSIALCV